MLSSTTSASYSIYVISSDGRVLRSATAVEPTIGAHLPRFSVAGQSVYFIDGDRALKVLKADGSIAVVGQLPGGPTDRVVFAVSQDERQLAFSVLHYNGSTASTSLRVGTLAGLAVHQIYAGSVTEFPIGWRAGRIILAVTRFAYIQNPGESNPYFAIAYHIADASNATRTFSTSPTCDEPSSLQGPVDRSGSACQQNSGNTQILLVLGWDGSKHEIFRSAVDGSANAVPPAVVSPSGTSLAAALAADHDIKIIQQGSTKSTAAVGTPAGWLDADHLLFMPGPCCQMLSSASVLDLATDSITPIEGLTGVADPYAPFFSAMPDDLG